LIYHGDGSAENRLSRQTTAAAAAEQAENRETFALIVAQLPRVVAKHGGPGPGETV